MHHACVGTNRTNLASQFSPPGFDTLLNNLEPTTVPLCVRVGFRRKVCGAFPVPIGPSQPHWCLDAVASEIECLASVLERLGTELLTHQTLMVAALSGALHPKLQLDLIESPRPRTALGPIAPSVRFWPTLVSRLTLVQAFRSWIRPEFWHLGPLFVPMQEAPQILSGSDHRSAPASLGAQGLVPPVKVKVVIKDRVRSRSGVVPMTFPS